MPPKHRQAADGAQEQPHGGGLLGTRQLQYSGLRHLGRLCTILEYGRATGRISHGDSLPRTEERTHAESRGEDQE